MIHLTRTQAQGITFQLEDGIPLLPQLLPICKLRTFANPEFH